MSSSAPSDSVNGPGKSQKPRMRLNPDEKLAVYVASQELIKVSSLLPANKNRSKLVHSLIYSLGLLSNTGTPQTPLPTSPTAKRRIQVVNPIRATYKELSQYHNREYLDFVLDPKNSDFAGDEREDERGGFLDRYLHKRRVREKRDEEEEEEEERNRVSKEEFGLVDDCPLFHGLPVYIQLVAGATLTGVKALCKGIADVAICWDGGRHHAKKSHASGFCYVSDCILALMALKKGLPPVPIATSPNQHTDLDNMDVDEDREGQQRVTDAESKPQTRKPRIMYIDLDLHFSDAVSEAFSQSTRLLVPQILTLSIHHASPGFFPASPLAELPAVPRPRATPFTESQADIGGDTNSTTLHPPTDLFQLSIPLTRGASSASYARIWPIVESIRNTFQPDCVVVQCGVDALAEDPCTTFNWTLNVKEEGSLGWCVDRIVNRWEGKKLILGGGGYHSANAARAWAYITSIVLGRPLDLETLIPDHAGFPEYGPSFTLDVPAGNMQDTNTETGFEEIEARYEQIIELLKARLNPI